MIRSQYMKGTEPRPFGNERRIEVDKSGMMIDDDHNNVGVDDQDVDCDDDDDDDGDGGYNIDGVGFFRDNIHYNNHCRCSRSIAVNVDKTVAFSTKVHVQDPFPQHLIEPQNP